MTKHEKQLAALVRAAKKYPKTKSLIKTIKIKKAWNNFLAS
jgi:hypothetical protein